MLFSINDLNSFSATATDFEASIVDVFLDRKTWKVSHLVLDVGGVLENRVIVVPGDLVSNVDPGERKVGLNLTKAEADNATPLQDLSLRDISNFSEVPELLFGADAASIASEFFSTRGHADAYASHTAATASTVKHAAEEIGSVIDFLADDDTMTATHVVVDTGVTMPKSQHVLPAELVEKVGNSEEGTVVSVDHSKVENSPPLEEFNGLDRHWTDRIASYYGLS